MLFEVEDKEEKRADGSTYVESDATMTALEVRSREGKILQKLAIEGGTTSYLGSGQSGVRLQLDDRNSTATRTVVEKRIGATLKVVSTRKEKAPAEP